MRGMRLAQLWLALTLSMALLSPTFAQGMGAKQKLSGVIVNREADSLVLLPAGGTERTVKFTSATEVTEKKSNPFREARKYEISYLLRGLKVEVEGRSDSSGALVAEKVRFTNDDFKVAQTVESRVTPVEISVHRAETRMTEAETRLAQSEENAKWIAGQMEELDAVSNAARGGAKAAQETADSAVAGVQATNERITAIDDYQPQKGITVQFKVGSAVLSPEAKAMLDELAAQAKVQRAFVIEVTGFASADGSESLNRSLSQRRADAVVRYLAANHDIPLRRITTPFGHGESRPVADNSTRQGRQQNRRVEVRVLVSRGLTVPAAGQLSSAISGPGQGK